MILTANDFVWYEQDGEVHSAGYSIDSLFKKMGIKPMTTLNESVDGGMVGGCQSNVEGSPRFSDLFRTMGVPAGLSTMIGGQMSSGLETSVHDAGVVPDSLYDRLMGLMTPDQSSTITHGGRRKKRTKKNHRLNTKEVKTGSGKKRNTRKRNV